MSEKIKMRIGLTISAFLFYLICLPGILTFREMLAPGYSDTILYKFLRLITFYYGS